MSVKCNTKLDLPADGFVYSGHEITGTVTLRVSKPMLIKGVSIKVKGKGKCRWYETRSTGSQNMTVWYAGKEKYLSIIKDLITPEEGENTTLDTGVHTFPFSFHIPAHVPSTTVLPDANIRYYIQTQIHQRKRKLKFDTPFVLFSHLDLNTEAFARDPIFTEHTKNFWNFTGNGGEMSVEVRSPAGGYVPGQMIPLSCRIFNESRVQTKNIEAALYKVITYTEYLGHSRKLSPVRMERVICDKLVLEQDGSMNANLQLPVPSDLATTLYNSKIISVEYILRIKVKVSGLHRSPVLYVPLVIGSIPLRSLYGPAPDYMTVINEPPPSYEEIMRAYYSSSENMNGSTEDINESIETVSNDDIYKPPLE